MTSITFSHVQGEVPQHRVPSQVERVSEFWWHLLCCMPNLHEASGNPHQIHRSAEDQSIKARSSQRCRWKKMTCACTTNHRRKNLTWRFNKSSRRRPQLSFVAMPTEEASLECSTTTCRRCCGQKERSSSSRGGMHFLTVDSFVTVRGTWKELRLIPALSCWLCLGWQDLERLVTGAKISACEESDDSCP